MMIKIRNARQYQEALDTLYDLEIRFKYGVPNNAGLPKNLSVTEEDQMLALAAAIDEYELSRAEVR